MLPGTSDFRLLDATVVEIFKEMRDSRLFVRGFSHWIGFPRVTLEYHCGSRYAGKSKYSLRKMLNLSIASLFSFSTIPLRLGIWLGFCTGMIAMGELVYIFWAYAHGRDRFRVGLDSGRRFIHVWHSLYFDWDTRDLSGQHT